MNEKRNRRPTVREATPRRQAAAACRALLPSRRSRRRREEFAVGWHRRAFFRPLAEQLEPRVVLAGPYDQVDPAWFAAADAGDGLTFIGPVPAAAVVSSVRNADAAESGWLVRVKPEGVTRAAGVEGIAELLSRDAARFQVRYGLGLPGLVAVSTNVSDEFAASVLAANPLVEFLERDQTIVTQRTPNDPDFVAGSMVGLHNTGQFGGTDDADIDAPEIWNESVGSPSVVVGVVDSGIDATHPDLYLNIWINQGEIPASIESQLTTANADINDDGLLTFYDLNNCAASVGVHDAGACDWTTGPSASLLTDFNANGYIDALDLLEDPRWADGIDNDGNGFIDDFFGWNFRSTADEPFAPNNPSDVLGHGTHVSGTIGAIGDNGVGVTGVNWQTSIMALKFLDPSNQGKTSDAIRALNYVTMMKTDYGVNVPVTNNSWGQAGGFSASLEAAIRAAGEAGILFVAAAGNGNILGRGVNNDVTPFYPASYDLDNVIAVAASDANDQLAQFSNFGATSVDIAAPGVGIRSTLPDARYGTANGTSMATPHVAGTAALIWSALPASSLTEVRDAILAGVDDPNTVNAVTGFQGLLSTEGRLNAFSASTASVFSPSAVLEPAGDVVSASSATHQVTVKYYFRGGIDQATIGAGDVVVSQQWGPRAVVAATLVNGSLVATDGGDTVEATYEFTPPGGSWDALDFGHYRVTVLDGSVLSTAASGALPVRERDIGSFHVQVAADAVFYVNTTRDTVDANVGDGLCADTQGACSLRAATQEANAVAPIAASNLPQSIPDGNTAVSGLDVSGLVGSLIDVNVSLDITHASDADLEVFLVSPAGTRVELFSDVGGSSANFTATVLDDEATATIIGGSAPFTGSFQPLGSLGDFNGEDPNGTWKLEVTDDASGNGGTVNAWSLNLDTDAASNDASSDVPKSIANGAAITSTVTISNQPNITDINVELDIAHTSDGDLDVFLISPAGTRVELFTDVGGSSDNFTGTILDDEASSRIVFSSAPFSGSYRPEGTLSAFDGQDPNGTWTLEITDDSSGNDGTLNSWSLHFAETLDATSNTPTAVPDASPLASTLNIAGFVGNLADLSVQLDITHTRDADLEVFLTSPAGTRVNLFADIGGSGDNFTNTILDDGVTSKLVSGVSPFTGWFRPEGALSSFSGEDPNGTWTLEIIDDFSGEVGTLNGWSIQPVVPTIILDDGVYDLSIAHQADVGSTFPFPDASTGCTTASQQTGWSNETTGDLDIIGNVKIAGNQTAITMINANGTDRIFKVHPGAKLSLSALTVAGGVAPGDQGGGGILSAGALNLDLVTVTDNFTSGLPDRIGGGGIASWGGDVQIHRSTLSENVADIGGGLLVCNLATATITQSTLNENVARSGAGLSGPDAHLPGGGGIASLHGGLIQIENTTLSANAAANVPGAAIFNLDGAWRSMDVPKSVNDNATVTSDLIINGIPGVLTDVDVELNITHPWDSDLDVFLISPSNTRVELFTDIGSSDDNFTLTVLDDDASDLITSGSAPFTGRYQPEQSLSLLNGEDPNGTWKLEVSDDASSNEGFLTGWSITLRTDQTSNISLNHVTVALHDELSAIRGAMDVHSSLFAANADDWDVAITDLGHNVFDAASSIGPLQFNGGSTATHALLAGSSAFDAADPDDFVATDQRGLSRPQRGRDYYVLPDVGAVEMSSGSVRGLVFLDRNGDGLQSTVELGIPAITLYVDENTNGQLDPGEPSVVSDNDNPLTDAVSELGGYRFDNLPSGPQRLAVLLPDNWSLTTSSGSINLAERYTEEVSIRSESLSYNGDSVTYFVEFASSNGYYETDGFSVSFVELTFDPFTGPSETLVDLNYTITGPPSISGDGRYVGKPFLVQYTDPFYGPLTVRDWTVDNGVVYPDASVLYSLSTDGDTVTDVEISSQGRFVALTSSDPLVADDTNGQSDVFVWDRQTDDMELVSKASDGTQSNGGSTNPSISADGRYVAFESIATNLVPGSPTGRQIYVFDRYTQTIELVSKSDSGEASNGTSSSPKIDGDGRTVVFESLATNLDNLEATQTEMPSVSSTVSSTDVPQSISDTATAMSDLIVSGVSTSLGDVNITLDINHSYDADLNVFLISPAGTRVELFSGIGGSSDNFTDTVFDDDATTSISSGSAPFTGSFRPVGSLSDFNGQDPNGTWQLEVEDTASGDTGSLNSWSIEITSAAASGLDADIFIFDRQTETIERISKASDATASDGPSSNPTVSADGRFIAFDSSASNLVTGDDNGQTDVFVYDRTANAIVRASVGRSNPTLSGDGRFIAAGGLIQLSPFASQTETSLYLHSGEVISDTSFGLVPNPGEIRGIVFEDILANEVRDIADPGLGNWKVYLDVIPNGQFDPGEPSVNTTSDVNGRGEYVFTNLDARQEYTVRVIAPDGWEQLLPTVEDGGWNVFLPAGGTVSGRDFGFVEKGTGGQFENATIDGMLFSDVEGDGDSTGNLGIGGVTVFLDLNDDGIRQFDEPRTVTLHDNAATVGIDESGHYTFASLGNRPYTVRPILDAAKQLQTSPLGNELTKFSKSFAAPGVAFSNPQDVVVEDFTGDGIPDLAVALFERNVVSILPGVGNGGFLAPIDIALPDGATGPVALLSGDFNGQGSLDLAVANNFSGSVTILLDFNSTTNRFASKTKVNVGSGPRSLASGRFDNDADLDLVVANEKSNSLTILRNNGSGTFTAVASTLAVGKNPFSVVAVQLTDDNGDQVADENDDVDLVVANFGQYPTGADLGSVSVLHSNGSGGFNAATSYAAGFGPAGVAAGDFNQDGYPDVAVANFLSDTITLLINKQDGTFPTNKANRPGDLSAGTGPADLEAADLDNDGDDDLVIINRNSKDISILRNQVSQLGSLGFEPGESFGLGDFPTAVQLSVSTGDVNRDGLLDLAVTNGTNNNVSVFVNQLVGGAHRVGLTGVETVSGLNFGIQPLNIPPTLNAIASPATVNEDDPNLFVIPLDGITAGAGESQDLGLSVSSDNPALFSQLDYTYTANAATGSINYRLAQNAHGTTVVTVTVTDAGLDSNLATAADNGSFSRSFTVIVNAVNDDPQAVGDPATTAEDTAVVIDWDELLQNDTDLDSPSSQWLISSVEDAREGVATNQPGSRSVRFVPRGDFHGTASFRYTLRDGDGGTSTSSVTVTVTARNDAPTDLRLDQLTVHENNAGAMIGNLAVDDVDLPTDTYTWTVSDSRLEVTNSPWTLKLRSGESFDHEATQSVTVSVTGRDAGNAAITRDFTLTIIDVNEFAPALSDTQFSVPENQAASVLVGTVTATDQDRTQSLVYSITSGNVGGVFAIDSATGAIRTTSSLNHEARSRFDLGVTVTDNLSPAKFSSATVTVLVGDVNEFDPVLGNATLSVNENTPANTLLVQLAAQDNDTSQSISYAIQSGNASGAFSLDAATGQLRVADASKLDFETAQQFVLSVRATDSAAASRFDDATVSINLMDVNEFDPALGNAALSVAENSATNTLLGQVAASDQDSLQTVTYSILSGNTGGAFGLNASTGQLRVADASKLDYETAQQFILTIKATDNGQPSRADTATVTITLGDVNEFDPILEDAILSTSGTSLNDAFVGRLLATDGDRLQQTTYAIVAGNANGAFWLDSQSGELRVADAAKLVPGTESLTVRATDNGQPSRSDDAAVTINVLGGTQSQPVLDDATFSLGENSALGSLVGQLTATDQDAGQVISYAIVAGNGSGAFSLGSSTGELRVANAAKIDFEVTPQFMLTIRASDNGQPQLSDTATVLVNLQDVNEFDPALNGVAWTLGENSPVNTLVGQVLATDLDTAQSVTYAILSGNDAGAFALDAASGEVRVADASKLDFETASQFTLSVRASDNGTPARSRDATVMISLQDVNEFDPAIADAVFSIDENMASDELLGQLNATDGDTAQSVSFAILSGNAAGAFRVGPASGELRVADASKLDYETTRQFTLTVKATDNGQPGRSSTATVVFSLQDVNEFDPLLDDANWTLSENSSANALVGRVVATDQDTAQNVSYTIIAGNETGAFALHPTTGDVRVADPLKLDFEATPQFTLVVRATDNGTPVRSRDATVTIDLLDANEFGPVLGDATFTLDENVAVDTLVGQVTATDADTSQSVSFSIQSGNTSGAFRLDPASGELRVADASKLDFEATSQFVLTIQATDNGVPARTDTASVAVVLRDLNEFPPVVADAAYNIPENSPNGTIVGTIPVSDLESQQAHTFQILAGNVGDAFAVDATTGAITVADSGRLDRESRAQFVLTVRVDDAVAPAQFDTGTITIDINDANEFGPTIDDGNFTIREDAGVGAVVGTLVASDPDSTGSIEFALIGGNAAGVFELDAATGEIRIRDANALNFETRQEYLLLVTVRETVAPGRSDAAVVTIMIEDVNEFDPVLGDATFALNENAAIGTLVGHVSATDGDNSQSVGYAILAGNDSGAFSLNASSGELRVADNVGLDFEAAQKFTLTIQATDHGQPARSGTATVTIDLRDVNEFPPVLDDATLELDENSPAGTVVGQLAATDADTQQAVTYAIQSGNGSGAFVVDSGTGEIRVADGATLNFEARQQFTLTIQATDNGLPARTGIAIATIHLRDVNEFAPVIDEATFTLAENTANNTLIGQVIAMDDDTAQTISYSIQGGNSNGAFSLDATTGELRVTDASKLDFEALQQFVLTIRATDSGQPARSETATVTVDLLDINEFAPVINDAIFSLDENSAPDTVVGTVAATDGDTSQTVVYTIQSGNNSGVFGVNTSTGELRVVDAAQLDFEAAQRYTLTILATDSGQPSRSGTATVTIDVLDINEFDPVLDDAHLTLNENSVNETIVGQLVGNDGDSAQTLRYTIVSGNSSGAFTLSVDNGELRVADADLLDFETTPRFTLTIQVTDSGLPPRSATATVTINVRDVNEFAPLLDDATFALNENVAADTPVGQVSATDSDTAQTISYSIQAGNDNGAFSLNPTSGELRVTDATRLDFESTQQFTLTVRATDSGQPARSDDATWTINLSDVNEFDPVVGDVTFSLSKKSEAGTLVGQLTATDQDTAQHARLQILGGDPTGIFHIEPTTGELRVADAGRLNVVTAPELLITVRATDDGQPARSTTATVTIQVTGLNQPPVAEDDASETDEDTAVDIAVLMNDRDPNTGDTLYLVSASSAQGARLTINADGTLQYDPSQVLAFQDLGKSESVEDEVTYTIEDDGGLQATAMLVMTVHGNHDWHNAALPFDTNRDGSVTPADALVIINRLNAGGPGELPSMIGVADFALDTNDDGAVSPVDALQIVNSLNGVNGEGESFNALRSSLGALPRSQEYVSIGGVMPRPRGVVQYPPLRAKSQGSATDSPSDSSRGRAVSDLHRGVLSSSAVDQLVLDLDELLGSRFEDQ